MPPNIFTPLSSNFNVYQQFQWEKANWDLERKQLLKTIKEQAWQIEEKDNEIKFLQQHVTKVTELILELLSCKSPSPVYTLFLKEKMVNFQLSLVIQGLNPSLNTPQEFYTTFKSIPTTLKNLLCELYVHNLVVPNDTNWNSLLYVGDVRFREIILWM